MNQYLEVKIIQEIILHLFIWHRNFLIMVQTEYISLKTICFVRKLFLLFVFAAELLNELITIYLTYEVFRPNVN